MMSRNSYLAAVLVLAASSSIGRADNYESRYAKPSEKPWPSQGLALDPDRDTQTDPPSTETETDAPDSDADPASEASKGSENEPAKSPAQHVSVLWHTDYQLAYQRAVDEERLLFIYFHDEGESAARDAFEDRTLADPGIQRQLNEYVCLKLPRSARITSGGKEIPLLSHPSFEEMLRRPGVAIVDYAHPNADYYRHVVSTFPFTPGKYYRKQALSVILGLPSGTLTQRTMIYAVRIHPERPASTQGSFNATLASEAKQHSTYQAAILVQGHHSWDSRFQRINASIPNGLLAQEVVAESWPNESLVEACVDCVDSWRQSPGHWGAVRARHPIFGYDIRRGRNGIWYATGIFGRR